MVGGDGPLTLEIENNLTLRADGSALPMTGRFGDGTPVLDLRMNTQFDDAAAVRANMARVLETCGAWAWARDPIDARIVEDVRKGTGRIIDSENEVGGYPVRPETRAAFVESEWHLASMVRRSS